jgi:hypothetical protein
MRIATTVDPLAAFDFNECSRDGVLSRGHFFIRCDNLAQEQLER